MGICRNLSSNDKSTKGTLKHSNTSESTFQRFHNNLLLWGDVMNEIKIAQRSVRIRKYCELSRGAGIPQFPISRACADFPAECRLVSYTLLQCIGYMSNFNCSWMFSKLYYSASTPDYFVLTCLTLLECLQTKLQLASIFSFSFKIHWLYIYQNIS